MSDLLLEWMSYRGAGRISDLPAELANGSVFRIADDLSMLGHLEFVSSTSWQIAPPALAGLPGPAGTGAGAVLCGARTPGVLDGLTAACRAAGARLIHTPMPGRPVVVSVTAPTKSDLASLADAARLPLQHDAAFTLLACTPAIREWPRTRCAMVAGRVETVRRFSRSRLGWVGSTLPEATAARAGFFRIKRDWDWVSLLKTGVTDCAYIDDRAGRLAAAARSRAVSWTGESCTLSLPSQLYPPGTIARGLTLCTGALPHFDIANRRICFPGVTPEILRLTLAITGLRLA